jgi:hypothetical protein
LGDKGVAPTDDVAESVIKKKQMGKIMFYNLILSVVGASDAVVGWR